MKLLKISLLTATLICTISSLILAGEEASYDALSMKDGGLRAEDEAAPITEIPVYPRAEELSNETLRQGSFEIRTSTFRVRDRFKKVLKYYKKKMGPAAKIDLSEGPLRRKKAHFFLAAGSQSRNVILEEIGEKETSITFTIFEGGGGAVLE